MILWNPVVAMLFNTKLKRWHPILYYESPLPGPPSADKPVRHKSKGHHTNGFDTREEAVTGAKALAERIGSECSDTGKCKLALTEDGWWDGEDIPADVAFFIEEPDGTVRRAF